METNRAPQVTLSESYNAQLTDSGVGCTGSPADHFFSVSMKAVRMAYIWKLTGLHKAPSAKFMTPIYRILMSKVPRRYQVNDIEAGEKFSE